MTFPVPYGGISVTVERPTFDRFNDGAYTAHHVIKNCIEYPSSTSETSQNVGIRDIRTLIAPPGSDVTALDRIVLHDRGSDTPPADADARRAATYQVIGRPKDWIHAMNGWHPGMSVELEKIT